MLGPEISLCNCHNRGDSSRIRSESGEVQCREVVVERLGAAYLPRRSVLLEEELGGLGIGEWTNPIGGYFISFDSLPGCARAIVKRCKKCGVKMTPAGATWPYGKDPYDTNIRIAPSYPPLDDLKKAMEIFCICVKIAALEKLLG